MTEVSNMGRRFPRLAVVLILAAGVCTFNPRAQSLPASSVRQSEIAVTIDDLPLNGSRVELARLRVMTERFVSGLNRHHIPAVGFVNESLLYVPGEADARIALLKTWAEGGVELGNHTFSHMGFKGARLADYEDDFVRGESITKMLLGQKGRKERYFRHPFLQMGDTPEAEKSFESFIADRGYRIAPVTVGTFDWMYQAAYVRAVARGDEAMRRRVSDEYLKFTGLELEHCAKVADELFGRPIKHILLLHANELNADNFDALVKVIEDRGFRFITLEEALGDPVYRYPDKYAPTSDWLGQWAFSKGRKFDSPAPPDFIQKAYADAQK
jgi:peptidoglycan-N-acetylglucosamine deacetylase